MGQSSSIPESTRPTHPTRSRSLTKRFLSIPSATKSTATISQPPPHPTAPDSPPMEPATVHFDATSSIPDECLAIIFQSLPSADRKHCSLVCKRWLIVEGQNRHRLSLNATSEILPVLPSLFSRFDSVTKLALRSDRRSISLSDEALVLISLRCRNLTRLKLRGCREITDAGVAAFAANCRYLRKLSCGSCVFGAAGLNAVFRHCANLEEISIKRLRGINNDNNNNDNGGGDAEVVDVETIQPGAAALSLKSICLKELYNGQLFAPLIVGAKNLKTLKLIRCLGDWDAVLQTLATNRNGNGNGNGNGNCSMVEVHLERIQVTDVGLTAISSCLNLEILHLVKTPECTNTGIVAVAERCRLLRKVHIDGWRTNRIGDEGLSALGKNCGNLQELVLIGINPTTLSLGVISGNCKGLERLALCSSETIGDVALSCIASKCLALKKFCIKSCPISDNGLEALAWGCPNLVKIKVKKCKEVTREIVDWLRVKRESLIVNLDADEIEPADASASDGGGGGQEDVPDVPEIAPVVVGPGRSHGRGSMFRINFGFLFRRNVTACALRRIPSDGGNSGGGQ
ncbi:F-box protein At1g47056-like [Silene latifolia]|uniref:F-box protein At1g47056-like n=1 Tax=Silene latifolia TaxID=37657 RepID=UPI003D782CB4